MFQDIDNIVSLGSAISDISEMTLLKIYETLKNIRVNEIEKMRHLEKSRQNLS